MSQAHRFFFVFSLMIFLPIIFLLAITIYPIYLGLRMLCKSKGKPEAPARPVAQPKPEKPSEPSIGAPKEEWAKYRKDIDDYRIAKREWNANVANFKKNEHKIMDEYYERRKTYKKMYESDDESFGDSMIDATEYMLFYKEGNSRLMDWFIKNYVKS